MKELKPLQVWQISIGCCNQTCILLSRDKYSDSRGYFWNVASSYKGMGASCRFLTDDEVLCGKYLFTIPSKFLCWLTENSNNSI